MREVLTIAMREFKAAVKTKSFLVILILMPVFMGGSTLVSMISRNKVDTTDQKFIIVDNSGLFKESIQQSAKQRNEVEIFNPETNEKIRPAFIIEFIEPDKSDPVKQKLELSKRVSSNEISGFIEIGSSILHPDEDPSNAFVRFYSENTLQFETINWFSNPINNYLRQIRIADLGLPADSVKELFYWTQVEGMGLLTINESSGEIKDAEKSNIVMSIVIPYTLLLLMFMIVIMGVTPVLNSVMEEKMEKIAEVLLATVTPFQFMAGKIIGNTMVSLMTAIIYVGGGVLTADLLGYGNYIPYDLLPWFFIYLIFYLVMANSMMAALGAACNDNKDAQNVAFPSNLPMLLPLFIVWPVIQNPMGTFATVMSFIPPFTPLLMTVRLATPVTIPIWQAYLGLLGVILFTIFSVWVGARIFRTGILMQGQKPSLSNIFKFAMKS